MSIKNAQGGAAWTDWPAPLRDREPEALREASMSLLAGISFEKFVQFLFMRQWDRLKDYANTRGVHIFGDAPIYVTLDSSDCWANPELFKLGPDKKPRVVAGVPPDYFSATGQLWGNPVYDWSVHAQTGFSWWISRIGQCARLYDLLRIDHFRGFSAYWEVDATEETAINGTWVPAPGYDLFEALFARFTCLNIVAEDLGYITPDVRELRDAFNFPGMKVLQFTFGPEVGKNNYALHNHVENALAYTGTHDNNTTRGWYDTEAPDDDKSRLSAYTGKEIESHNVAWEMIRLAMMSVSRLAVFPIQDALNLGAWARMNTPAEANGNWAWRMAPGALTQELAVRLREMAVMFGRA
jgi:4-alpha-glucanotransferase